MKKASKIVLGGLAAVASAGVQAGFGFGSFDLFENCKDGTSGAILVEGDGACFEVAWRCDGDTGKYGVCLIGAFGGDADEMGGFWEAYENSDQFACVEENFDGFYGLGGFLGGNGAGTTLDKWQSKFTDATPGNGKKNHPGNKGGDTGTTVEVAMKRVECL